MATRKKTKTTAADKKIEFSPERRLTVSVGMSGEYGKIKVGLALSENVKDSDDPLVLSDEIFDALVDKLGEHFDKLADLTGYEPEEYPDEDVPEDDDQEDDDFEDEDEDDDFEDDDQEDDDFEDEDEDEDEDDPDDITPDDIMKMKKAELVELIKDEDLDINPKDFKKVADLKDAIIDAIFEPDDDEDGDFEDEDGDFDDDQEDDDFGDEDEDSDWDDDDWEDD